MNDKLKATVHNPSLVVSQSAQRKQGAIVRGQGSPWLQTLADSEEDHALALIALSPAKPLRLCGTAAAPAQPSRARNSEAEMREAGEQQQDWEEGGFPQQEPREAAWSSLAWPKSLASSTATGVSGV